MRNFCIVKEKTVKKGKAVILLAILSLLISTLACGGSEVTSEPVVAPAEQDGPKSEEPMLVPEYSTATPYPTYTPYPTLVPPTEVPPTEEPVVSLWNQPLSDAPDVYSDWESQRLDNGNMMYYVVLHDGAALVSMSTDEKYGFIVLSTYNTELLKEDFIEDGLTGQLAVLVTWVPQPYADEIGQFFLSKVVLGEEGEWIQEFDDYGVIVEVQIDGDFLIFSLAVVDIESLDSMDNQSAGLHLLGI